MGSGKGQTKRVNAVAKKKSVVYNRQDKWKSWAVKNDVLKTSISEHYLGKELPKAYPVRERRIGTYKTAKTSPRHRGVFRYVLTEMMVDMVECGAVTVPSGFNPKDYIIAPSGSDEVKLIDKRSNKVIITMQDEKLIRRLNSLNRNFGEFIFKNNSKASDARIMITNLLKKAFN